MLLESVAVSGQGDYEAVRGELLEEYLEDAFRDYRPPRFFLNDITRYWRTLGVDFAANVRQRGTGRLGTAERQAQNIAQAALCEWPDPGSAVSRTYVSRDGALSRNESRICLPRTG